MGFEECYGRHYEDKNESCERCRIKEACLRLTKRGVKQEQFTPLETIISEIEKKYGLMFIKAKENGFTGSVGDLSVEVVGGLFSVKRGEVVVIPPQFIMNKDKANELFLEICK